MRNFAPGSKASASFEFSRRRLSERRSSRRSSEKRSNASLKRCALRFRADVQAASRAFAPRGGISTEHSCRSSKRNLHHLKNTNATRQVDELERGAQIAIPMGDFCRDDEPGESSRATSRYAEEARAKPQTDNEALTRYCNCMEEIKMRVEVIEGFLTGKLSTNYLQPTVESVCLQFRKILELIALASLVAHKDDYSKQRENFALDWHAARILKEIEKINPAFYPVPGKQKKDPTTGKVLEIENVKEPYLTRSDFEVLYDICGGLLHAANPFGQSKDYEGFARSAPTWLSKIKTLLNHHQIQLADDNTQIWVLMVSDQDRKAHAFVMKKVGRVTSHRRSVW